MLQTTWTNIKESCGIKKSLTQMFLDDFKQVMGNYVIGIPGTTPPVPVGNGRFRLEEQTRDSALVKGATDESIFIRGYHVHPVPNDNNVSTLPSGNQEPYYMLTDYLNGCQFIAYGLLDNRNVTVEHNNFISNEQRYTQRLNEIRATNPKYLFYIRPGNVNNIINGGTYNRSTGIFIVGRYEREQWRFYIRDNVGGSTLPPTIYGPF